jgi:hypothetical protein
MPNTKKLFASLLVVWFALWLLLSGAIYVWGLALAATLGSTAIVLFSLVPLIGQAYLIWSFWSVTGIFFSSFTIVCLSWIVLTILLGTLLQRR